MLSRFVRHLRLNIGTAFLLFAPPILAEIASFTDSRGRTLLYQYSLKADWNPMIPRGVLIFFHGNNQGTQQDMLRAFTTIQTHAYEYDLIPVVVASPEARGSQLQSYKATTYSGDGTRFWSSDDETLIQELVQGHFEGNFRVDFEKVVFWGGSQGTCFLNRFVQRYGEDYGGGFLADCGCSGGPDPLWRPPDEFKERFRVFVRATTGDFLHTQSLQAYGYYKYIIGLDTLGDLEHAGNHCGPGNVSDRDAVDWLLTDTGLAAMEPKPHFKRVALIEGVTAITVDNDGALWIASQPTPGSSATLWRSVDRGHNIEPVYRTSLYVHDLDAIGNALILTTGERKQHRSEYVERDISFYRSTNQGKDFELLSLDGGARTRSGATTDTQSRIYAMTGPPDQRDISRSDDNGESWESLAAPSDKNYELVYDPIGAEGRENFLFLRQTGRRTVEWIGSTSGNDWRRIEESPASLHSVSWDGASLWTLAGYYARLYSSSDLGLTWEERDMPKAATITFGIYYWPEVTALSDGELLVIGGGYDGFHYHGDEWQHIFGGAVIGYARGTSIGDGFAERRMALDPVNGDVYVTDGSGVFRLDGDFRGFSGLEAADSDGDGISDPLDAFPQDASEFLDTDGDGIGNTADSDDDGDGIDDKNDDVPLDSFESEDTDKDGVGNLQDHDDDGDGVRDILDAFPLEKREQRDSDGDGIGDWMDDDDDGDGVADTEDAFPLYPHEWSDEDRDGIGDNIDNDDDNDGIPDGQDDFSEPEKADNFLVPVAIDLLESAGARRLARDVELSSDSYANLTYPPSVGLRQSYGHLSLGDGPDPNIHFMVDYGDDFLRVWFDRNVNRDLTDDGPPAESEFWNAWLWVEVTLSSGVTVPYGVQYGAIANAFAIYFGGAWTGDVEFAGSKIAVLTVDYDIDGIFDGPDDYVCVDTNEDRELDCFGESDAELFRTGDTIQLNEQSAQITVSASGHRVELNPESQDASMFPSSNSDDRISYR